MKMGDQSSPPSKRRRDYSPVEQPVIDQSSAADQQNTDTAELQHLENSTKIDDLDPQILAKIFETLDFSDLINVANATKKLREGARQIYAQNSTNKLVKFNDQATMKKGLNIDETPNTIEIQNIETCLEMFHAFGRFIRQLKLNFEGINSRRSETISRTLNECCAKTLCELEWHYCPPNAMDAESKPFSKVTSLRLVSGHLSTSMSQFNETFPALSQLELSHMEVKNRKCIERTFSNLTHIKVHIGKKRDIEFLKSNVKAAIELNPQLLSFNLASGCDLSLLAYIQNMLPSLERLEIQSPQNKFFDSDKDPVYFDTVRTFTLDIAQFKDPIINIPFQFKRLKKFTLFACNAFRNEWIDFVTQNANIVELHLLNYHWFYVMKREQLMKIASLPRLAQLVLDWRIDSPEDLVQFLSECHSLQKIQLSVRTIKERAAFCCGIDNVWDLNIDAHFLVLQRTEN